MSDPENMPVETWTALQSLGFEPEEDYIGCPSMSYDFGSFKLRATRVINLQYQEVVSFFGFLSNPRTMTSIEFQMPLHVESEEQCAAWIAWHVIEAGPRREKYIPRSNAGLLILGLQHQGTLPWERARLLRQQEADKYRLRPSCLVDRAMIKLGLKSLAKHIGQSADNDRIEIRFDGQILSFQINGKRVIVQAEGAVWRASYLIAAGALRNMPKRLFSEKIDVSIWSGRLQIDRSRYEGIIEVDPNAHRHAKA